MSNKLVARLKAQTLFIWRFGGVSIQDGVSIFFIFIFIIETGMWSFFILIMFDITPPPPSSNTRGNIWHATVIVLLT